MRTRYILAACWIASLALAVLLTRETVLHSQPEPQVEEQLVEVPVYVPSKDGSNHIVLETPDDDQIHWLGEQVPGDPSLTTPTETPPSLADAAPPAPLSAAKMHNTLGMALVSHDLIGRNLVIAHLLANLSPENVNEAIRAFENAPRSEHRDHSFRLFLHAWAEMDGPAAIAYLEQQPKAMRVGGSEHWAMSAWGQNDPQAALAFVQAQEPNRAIHLYHGLMRGWIRSKPAEATAHVEGIENPELRKRMVGVVARGTLEDHGTQAALQWIDRTTRTLGSTDPQYRGMVFDDVLRHMKPDSAPEVATWIDNHLDHPDLKPWVFQKVSRDYVKQNSLAAEDWVESYRLAHSEHFNYGVIGNFAGAYAQNDPYAAMDWANNMEMPSRRSSAYSQIANQWDENDLGRAERWLEEGRQDPLMDDARRRYSMRIARKDPVRALEYGTQIMREDYREESMVHAARILYAQNPQAIDAWLPVSGLGPEAQARIFAPANE